MRRSCGIVIAAKSLCLLRIAPKLGSQTTREEAAGIWIAALGQLLLQLRDLLLRLLQSLLQQQGALSQPVRSIGYSGQASANLCAGLRVLGGTLGLLQTLK